MVASWQRDAQDASLQFHSDDIHSECQNARGVGLDHVLTLWIRSIKLE